MGKLNLFKSLVLKTSFVVLATATFQISSQGLSTQTAEAKTTEDLILETANHYAKVGLTARWTETQANYCSRFVRQVFQAAFPKNAYVLDRDYFGASASESERMWARQGKLKSYSWIASRGGLKIGDVVFQNWLVDGHIGVVVEHKGQMMIAENTIRYGYYLGRARRTDFRALTTLAKFGKIKSVGRITGFASAK